MENSKFPVVTKELLDELDKRFPDRMPTATVPYEDYILRQGQMMVVRLLKKQFDLQNQNILKS